MELIKKKVHLIYSLSRTKMVLQGSVMELVALGTNPSLWSQCRRTHFQSIFCDHHHLHFFLFMSKLSSHVSSQTCPVRTSRSSFARQRKSAQTLRRHIPSTTQASTWFFQSISSAGSSLLSSRMPHMMTTCAWGQKEDSWNNCESQLVWRHTALKSTSPCSETQIQVQYTRVETSACFVSCMPDVVKDCIIALKHWRQNPLVGP